MLKQNLPHSDADDGYSMILRNVTYFFLIIT